MHLIREFSLVRNAGRQAAAALIVALVAVLSLPASADPARPSFLHTLEVRSGDLSQFTKWTSALSRSHREAANATARDCGSQQAVACRYQDWQRFLDGLHDQTKWEQLQAVNSYMNARDYVPDDRNWGVEDYWQTPGEFLSRSGDCEDFAIAKFLSLKQLGWTDDELRLVAVKDLKQGVGHAVLVATLDGKTWVLDNQLDDVTNIERLEHYQPVFSINETSWWLHQSLQNDKA